MKYVQCAIFTLLWAVLCLHSASANALTKDSIKAYYTAWSSGDVAYIMNVFSEDIIYEDVATGERSTGQTQVRVFSEQFLQENPGIRIEPTSILVGASRIAVEWTMSAGKGAEFWQVRGAAIMKYSDGKITHVTDYWNLE